MTSLGSGFTAGYRSDGLRAWKGTGEARTYYLYDQGEPIVELDSKGNIQAMNVFAPDGLVGRWSMTGPWAKTWSYYVFDQQGNVDHRTDAKGGLRSSSVYDAYGLDRANAGKDDPFGYNGRWGYYRDVETGLYLCQHRYYDPSTGRWLTRDPIGYAGGIGLYGYCGGGPVGSADSSGHSLIHSMLNQLLEPGARWELSICAERGRGSADFYPGHAFIKWRKLGKRSGGTTGSWPGGQIWERGGNTLNNPDEKDFVSTPENSLSITIDHVPIMPAPGDVPFLPCMCIGYAEDVWYENGGSPIGHPASPSILADNIAWVNEHPGQDPEQNWIREMLERFEDNSFY